MHDPKLRPPSKTQRKKAMHALQTLGEALVDLPAEQLDRLQLPEALHEAVLTAGRLRSREARRRQLQYIGRLMREVEADAIAQRLAHLRGESDAAKAEFHAVERWRARLIAEDDALAAWLAEHPDSDAQQLRQLIRNARREIGEGKPPRASRALFRLLRESYSTKYVAKPIEAAPASFTELNLLAAKTRLASSLSAMDTPCACRQTDVTRCSAIPLYMA